jgi:peptidoglycan hydrolase-like protein with peptidoglycan-binding domain
MANDVFDEHFKDRLMAFQRDHGLTLDGTLGPQAWTKLAEVASSKPEPAATVEETQTKPAVTQAVSRPSFAITAEEYPLLVKLAALCVDEAGAAQFIREELDIDLDEINATIEEVLA